MKSCRLTMANKKPKLSVLKDSCRSPKFKKIKEKSFYQVVTHNRSGEQVKVPTDNIVPTFIRMNTKTIPTPLKNEEKVELIKIIGRKKYKFEDALSIYENNQSYYLKLIEDQSVNTQLILKDVETLERWFCQIKEPKPVNEDEIEGWEKREEFKRVYEYSKYFDPILLYYYCKI